ncbi:MAG: hypothetical protein J5I47_02765 [Vicingus serpentipes]|nr:hypothetical protein [Vicingus serpentipes]
MSKNKWIAVAIIAVLFTVPFYYAYLNIQGHGGIVQALAMTVIIIAAIVAIILFNKSTGHTH